MDILNLSNSTQFGSLLRKIRRSDCQKAIDLLREDIANGFEHIMMARASTIERAKSIFKIYSNEKDLNPVLINSQTKNKKEVLAAIRNREHKIIVCVDMLGEGFDLPQLKISALHDPHKSINIMLQFTGRFTRTTKMLAMQNSSLILPIPI